MSNIQQWFKERFFPDPEKREIFVLYNQITDRYLTFDPINERYSEVLELKELKIWDWQYADVAQVAWADIIRDEKAITIQKLDENDQKLFLLERESWVMRKELRYGGGKRT